MSDAIKSLARKMPTRYLKRFFAEKDIPEVTWTLTAADGTPHIMSNVVVVEHIALVNKAEAAGLERMLTKIDFHNGSVNDYLKHLAGALINRPAAA